MARDDAHHQSRARAGITEVQRRIGLLQTADAAAFDFPDITRLGSGSAQRRHRFCGVDDVFGFEQPPDPRGAGRQRAKDQGTVRNRLVARHP